MEQHICQPQARPSITSADLIHLHVERYPPGSGWGMEVRETFLGKEIEKGGRSQC